MENDAAFWFRGSGLGRAGSLGPSVPARMRRSGPTPGTGTGNRGRKARYAGSLRRPARHLAFSSLAPCPCPCPCPCPSGATPRPDSLAMASTPRTLQDETTRVSQPASTALSREIARNLRWKTAYRSKRFPWGDDASVRSVPTSVRPVFCPKSGAAGGSSRSRSPRLQNWGGPMRLENGQTSAERESEGATSGGWLPGWSSVHERYAAIIPNPRGRASRAPRGAPSARTPRWPPRTGRRRRHGARAHPRRCGPGSASRSPGSARGAS